MNLASAPAISVLVTAYNREAYLPSCLDSILSSTWKDFEIVLVDDASTDRTASIGEQYTANDSRIRFFRNEKNLGDYPNRTRAASLARGKLLKFVDSDDIIYPHSLAIMFEAMETHPHAALGLSQGLPEEDKPYPWQLSSTEAWKKEFLGGGCMGCGPTGAIFRADAFQQIGGFRNWGILNDTDLWYRMSSRWPIILLPPGLVWWRRHGGQEFGGYDAALTYIRLGFRLTVETISAHECPLNEPDRHAALARARRRYARRIISLAIRGRNPMSAGRLAREAGLRAKDLIAALRRLP